MNAPRYNCLIAVIVLGAGLAQALLTGRASARKDPQAQSAHLQGQVTDRDTGQILSAARVSIPELGLETRTNSLGFFAWFDLPLSQTQMTVTLVVIAEGYGEWVMQNLLLVSGETAQINPQLGEQPTQIDLPPPVESSEPGVFTSPGPPQVEQSSFEQFLTQAQHLEIPENIRVGLTGNWPCDPSAPYTVVTLNFRDYLQHVLPNEWYRSASPEAFRAGAVAVKMFALYWVHWGGKWSNPPADVIDSTCDQYYIPGATFGPADRALEATWPWVLLRDGQLFQPFHKETSDCLRPDCMRQLESQRLAADGYTWDQILDYFYPGSQLVTIDLPPAGFNLRFFGNGQATDDRVAVPLHFPERAEVSPPVDVGADDFTLEFWIKANPAENPAPAVPCGDGDGWRFGNVIFDHDRPGGAGSAWGLSLGAGRLAFGLTGESDAPSGAGLTACSRSSVADGLWHHAAVQRRRSDGWIWLFIDGRLEASLKGPGGDISYPDDASQADFSEPYLILGASRLDGQPGFTSFSGWLDEVHFSSGLRYPANGFSLPTKPFNTDPQTLALYHFDEGQGHIVRDTGGSPSGTSDGVRYFGGEPNGPDWVLSDLFVPLAPAQYLPLLVNQSP